MTHQEIIAQEAENRALVPKVDFTSLFLEKSNFDHLARVAGVFSRSALVPQNFRGKQEDCFLALQMALRLNIDPLLCLQNIVFIGAIPTFRAQFAIALANTRGPFKGVIRYREKGEGKNLEVTAYAFLRDGGEEVSATVSMAMAEVEGWTRNAKYRSMASHMLHYRAAVFLIRRYCPEVLCGFELDEEAADVKAAGRKEAASPGIIEKFALKEATEEPAAVETQEQKRKVGRPRKETPAQEPAAVVVEVPASAPQDQKETVMDGTGEVIQGQEKDPAQAFLDGL